MKYFHSPPDYYGEKEAETFEDWSERIARERRHKKRAADPRFHNYKKAKKCQADRDEKAKIDTAKLEREHREYVERMAKLSAARRLKAAKIDYQQRWENLPKLRGPLTYDVIPWPDLKSLESFVLTNADRTDSGKCRKLLREEQIRWHPDKFAQKFGEKLNALAEKDRLKIVDQVKLVSQELNALSQKFAAS